MLLSDTNMNKRVFVILYGLLDYVLLVSLRTRYIFFSSNLGDFKFASRRKKIFFFKPRKAFCKSPKSPLGLKNIHRTP